MSDRVSIESLRLHPAANRVPMANDADLSALRDSLREHGQQDPLDVTAAGEILDGRTRWTLLRELRAATVEVRIVDIPADQRTNYIVDRALARRHLTAEQKRALNILLREVVVEEVQHPKTGETVRIGKAQTQRAAILGVDDKTVRRWDEEDGPRANDLGPTHYRQSDGRIQPAHVNRDLSAPKTNGRAPSRPTPRARRPAPAFTRHFAIWCRQTRPEDKKLLLRLDRELHEAITVNRIVCDHHQEE